MNGALGKGGSVVKLAGRRAGAVDHGVGPGFEAHQDQGEDGHDNLKALGALLFGAELTTAPLRGRLATKPPNPCEDSKIHDGSERGDPEHGNADGVCMPAAGGRVDAGGSGQGGESDGNADAADG